MAKLQGSLNLSRSTITEVVLDPNTPKQHIVAGTSGGGGGSGKVDQIVQSGELRRYGNGSVRLILGSSVERSQTLTLRALSPAQVERVKSLLGHTVCYRDIYGRKVFGAFLDISISTIPFSGDWQSNLTDIALKIESTTYDEAV